MENVLLTLPGLTVPARTAGAPRATAGGVLLPRGPVAVLHPFGMTRFYRHGWHSWSPVDWVSLARPPERPGVPRERWYMGDDAAYLAGPRHGGSAVGAVEGPHGAVLLLGALGVGARVEADDEVLRGFIEEGAGEEAGEASPDGWFLGYGDPVSVFARYAELLGERLGKRGLGSAPRVWCSWYSFYRDISEAQMAEVLEGLQGLAFDVFQIDDGWQREIGEWEPNERFPSGMAAMAERIRRAGFKPGLWMAPFIVAPASRLYREHPEWLLKDVDGRPAVAGYNWGDYYYALDTTHPEVEKWLRELISKVRGWGYEYLKLDFLYAAAMPGPRYRSLHREQAYRQALRVIREAAGDEAYILVCGAPVIASVGLADAVRIGPDVAPFWEVPYGTGSLLERSWPGSRNAVCTSLNRLWLQPLIHTDPDVVYFRSRYNLLTPKQKAWLQDLARVSGFQGTSDPPGWLDAEERQAMAAFIEARPTVERLGPYRFRIDGREVDFQAALQDRAS